MPLRLPRALGRPIIVHPPAGVSNSLAVPYFAGEQPLWCWAACCQMIFEFFNQTVPQCDIASWALERSDCCSDPFPPSQCNQSLWTVHPTEKSIFAALSNWDIKATHNFGEISFPDLRAQIDAGHLVEVAYAWSGGGGGHVAIVRGYKKDAQGIQTVTLNDPNFATYGTILFSSLQTAYGLGAWTETFEGIRR